MNLRPYQRDCITAINNALATRDDNVLAVIPTAGGKTVVFSTMVQEWLQAWPTSRICVLAHVKELLTQAEDKLKKIWPNAPVGIWSAGIGRRERNCPITIAGIQSIYKRAFDFEPWDILIVDEAHLIPTNGEGMYRRFIKDARLMRPHLRVVGFTATPYRIAGGHIANPRHVLNHVCYEANVRNLIKDGFICQLTSKAGESVADTSAVPIQNGDFVQDALSSVVNTDALVSAAVREIVAKGQNRKCWLIFCVSVDHARHVSQELAVQGITAPVIVGETPPEERARLLEAYDKGEIRALCNVNVLTTGLDVTRIDMIAMLRPTQSTSLYIQMVGRGFRLHPGKENCLVLDLAGNIERHGPIDAVEVRTSGSGSKRDPSDPPAKMCPQCREMIAPATAQCPACGFEFPPREIVHDTKASTEPILSHPHTVAITDVETQIHKKEGKPDSLQVNYWDGKHEYREWVCLEHKGYAAMKAAQWWRRRFTDPVPATVAEAKEDLYLDTRIKERTAALTVVKRGKYFEILDVVLRTKEIRRYA